MTPPFQPGDDLVFQLESGFGLLRVLAVDEDSSGKLTWHLLAYDDFFPSVEAAEAAIATDQNLPTRIAHMALTNRAFERTPASRLGNRPVTPSELAAYHEWQRGAAEVSDRSALLMLGIR